MSSNPGFIGCGFEYSVLIASTYSERILCFLVAFTAACRSKEIWEKLMHGKKKSHSFQT